MKRAIGVLIIALIGCQAGDPELEPEPMVSARPMPGVAFGDCVEARRRAVAKPDLDVDKLPTPIKQEPPPLRRMPTEVRSAVIENGAIVKVDVLVDTLGRAVMSSFKVVKSSNPWLAANLKSAIPTWRFRPAELAGCKVARTYHFSATAAPRSKKG